MPRISSPQPSSSSHLTLDPTPCCPRSADPNFSYSSLSREAVLASRLGPASKALLTATALPAFISAAVAHVSQHAAEFEQLRGPERDQQEEAWWVRGSACGVAGGPRGVQQLWLQVGACSLGPLCCSENVLLLLAEHATRCTASCTSWPPCAMCALPVQCVPCRGRGRRAARFGADAMGRVTPPPDGDGAASDGPTPAPSPPPPPPVEHWRPPAPAVLPVGPPPPPKRSASMSEPPQCVFVTDTWLEEFRSELLGEAGGRGSGRAGKLGAWWSGWMGCGLASTGHDILN